MRERGTEYIQAVINYGASTGMPNWGTSGDLTDADVDLMARYVQQTPPTPPEFGMKEMKATWKVIVPPAQRPTKKMNGYNIENIFSTTLRDTGEVALIDGDTKKIINIVKTGYAVHISRLSHSGRYVYTIGRDGKIDLILEYVNQQKGRAQAALWVASALGVSSGGLSAMLITILNK